MKAWAHNLLHPMAGRRAARARAFLQSEQLEYSSAIDRRRRTLDEEVARLTREHQQRLSGNVQAPGLLERALMPIRLEYLRALVSDHIEIRKRLAEECQDLLLSESLDALEDEMIRTVDNFRLARDGDFKRRVATSGLPQPRSLYRDDAEYGEVVAMIRREVQLLRLRPDLAKGKKKPFTRDHHRRLQPKGLRLQSPHEGCDGDRCQRRHRTRNHRSRRRARAGCS